MAAGQTRAFFALIVAVTFGVLQVLCACIPASAQAMNHSMAHAEVTPGHAVHSGHDDTAVILIADMAAGHAPADMPPGHCDPDPSGHDHVENCSHCDGANLVSASADLPNATPAELGNPLVAVVSQSLPSPHRAGMAATNLASLRWRDPPRPSPVTLKTLALI